MTAIVLLLLCGVSLLDEKRIPASQPERLPAVAFYVEYHDGGGVELIVDLHGFDHCRRPVYVGVGFGLHPDGCWEVSADCYRRQLRDSLMACSITEQYWAAVSFHRDGTVSGELDHDYYWD